MRVILIGLAVLVILAVGAVVLGPSLIPASVYRDQIASAVEKATGREFKIDGKVSIKVFPGIKASVEKASLGNAPDGEAKTMADIGRLDVGLALLPLLSRRAEITSFVLNDAVIHLEVAKDGTPNWDFEKTREASSAAAKSEAKAGKSQSLSELSLGDVRLVNGLVSYKNLKSSDHYELQKMNAKIELPSLDKPFKLAGDAVYNAQKLSISTEVAKPRAAMDKGTTAVTLKVDGAPLSASFGGDVTFGDKATFAGDTTLDVPSVRKLSSWLGTPMSGDKGFGHMAIAGQVSFTGDDFAFDNADLKFDDIHATGGIKGKLNGKVPYISATLATDNLDLRPYIEESGKTAGGGAGSAPSAAKSSAGWSTEPIDASALKAFNADINFAADKIFVRDLKIDKSVVAINVNGGVMTANLKELNLYSGQGKGIVTLDASKSRAQLSSNLALSGLNLAAFMKDAAKTQRFEGTGAFNINVHGAGQSQKDIVSSLAGNAGIDFKNGAIKGVDLTKIARVVNTLLGKKTPEATQAEGTTEGQSAGDETKFVAMGGTFVVNGGVATTNDFKMINELVSLSGQGSINLVQQTIDFRVDPGRSQTDGGLKVALLVKGPLAKPKIVPDATGLIQNQLDKVLGDLLGGKEKKPMQGETGATTEGTATGGTTEPPVDERPKRADQAKEILKGLFGK